MARPSCSSPSRDRVRAALGWGARAAPRFAGRAAAAALLAISIARAPEAFAANRSLAAAEDALPGDADALVSANVAQLTSTRMFQQIFPLATSALGARPALDKVKKACGFDPTAAIDDVTLGLTGPSEGAAFVAMSVGEQKFTSCVSAIVKQETGNDVTTKKTGDEIAFSAGSRALFVRWLPGDVLALGLDPSDEAALKKLTGGAGAFRGNAAMMGWLAQLDPDALLLGAETRSISQKMFTTRGGAFSLADKSSVVTAKVLVDLGSSSDADEVARGASIFLALVAPKNAPPEVTRALRSVDVKASGSIVTGTASASEVDLAAIAGWLMNGMP
jgi:hypothetical protein